jgi:hypothetical protein
MHLLYAQTAWSIDQDQTTSYTRLLGWILAVQPSLLESDGIKVLMKNKIQLRCFLIL